MKCVAHPGKMGDVVFALYGLKYTDYDTLLLVSDWPSGWTLTHDRTNPFFIKFLCEYQDYIDKVLVVTQNELGPYNAFHMSNFSYRMHQIGHLLGSAIALFGLQGLPEVTYCQPWITAPKTKKKYDLVSHISICRDEREFERWSAIFEPFDYLVIGSRPEIEIDCNKFFPSDRLMIPKDMLDAADYINSARMFVGTSSCPYAIADALKKLRLIEIGGGADLVRSYDNTSIDIENFTDEQVTELIHKIIEEDVINFGGENPTRRFRF